MRDQPRTLPSAPAQDVAIDFEGRRIPAVAGEPVGVALLRAGHFVLSRSIKYHRPRGLFCLAEHCGSCLMRIDGAPDRFACAVPCAEGLAVSTQNALPAAGTDLLRAIDWIFPGGMDHHEMLAGVPVAQAAMQRVARQLAGLGELPDRIVATGPTPAERRIPLCIVGLGEAGRAAANAAAAAGISALVLDLDRTLSPVPGLECWLGATALAVYRDGGSPLVAVRRESAIERIRPDRLLLCVGSRDQGQSFENNDLPGILGGRALLRLLARHRLLPSGSALILGDGPDAARVCRELLLAGAQVTWAAEQQGPGLVASPALELLPGFFPVRAHGGQRLKGLELAHPSGARRDFRGGTVALCGPRAPAFELGVQCGAPVKRVARGFALEADDAGATAIPWLSAAGSCTSAEIPSEAHGARALARCTLGLRRAPG